MPDRPSIAQALDEAAGQLERAGVLSARREATALWAAVEGVRPGDVWLKREGGLPALVAARFWAAVERRSSGVPVGTGCGCIALALAQEGAFARVTAVEHSPEAAALARENVERVRPRTPVEVREGDLLEPLRGERFRAIVSNPPYLSEADYGALDPSVRCFEPRDALVSGSEGLDATRALFAGAAALLEPGAVLVLEIDARRADQVRALARTYRWARIDIHNDVFGRPRYALASPRED